MILTERLPPFTCSWNKLCLFIFSRRMFPTVRVSFTNVDPHERYAVLIDIVPVDNKRFVIWMRLKLDHFCRTKRLVANASIICIRYRYAYHRSSWLVAGKADPPSPNRLYVHPDAPYTGDQLRKQVVSFEKVKLTNNEMDKSGHVSTNVNDLDFVWSEVLGEARLVYSHELLDGRTVQLSLLHCIHSLDCAKLNAPISTTYPPGYATWP